MWLHIPTSLSSPASECSTSDFTSPYQALAASVTVSGKARRPLYWRAAWQKASWTKRLSTPTCDPSQSNRIVAAWLESLAGSPAKTSVLPADKLASTASVAGCSLKSSDSFASWSPSSGCFLKTSPQFSLFPQEQPYSENLPRSGSMRSGQLYARPTVAHHTGAIERSSWPTPMANDVEKRGQFDTEKTVCLTGVAQTWPTPRGTDGAKGGPNQAGSRGDLMLPSAAAMWSTPNVPGGGRALTPEQVAKRGATESGKRQVGLENEAKFWSTPNARDDHNPSRPDSERTKRKLAQGWTIDLNEQAAWWNAESAWPTPAARDHKGANADPEQHKDQLANFVCHSFHPDQPTPTPGQQSLQSGPNSRRLSPVFVEWLMAVPLGWTDFAPLGTEWFRYRQQLRSAYLRIVREFSGKEVPNEG